MPLAGVVSVVAPPNLFHTAAKVHTRRWLVDLLPPLHLAYRKRIREDPCDGRTHASGNNDDDRTMNSQPSSLSRRRGCTSSIFLLFLSLVAEHRAFVVQRRGKRSLSSYSSSPPLPTCLLSSTPPSRSHVASSSLSTLGARSMPEPSSGGDSNNNRSSSSNNRSAMDGTLRPSPGLFELDGWKNIAEDLDRFPLWTVATAQSEPLAYSVTVPTFSNNNHEDTTPTSTSSTYMVPFFWCDVAEALSELETSRQNTEMEGLDIIPFPLGTAFQLWCSDRAVIVPSRASVLQAGDDYNNNINQSRHNPHDHHHHRNSPLGQTVPMWTCLDISEQNEDDGRPLLPIFMALDDANAAVTEAVKTDGGKLDDFEVVCLTLSGAIEQLATVPEESPSFHFIPPSTSMQYIEDYLD